MISSSDEASMEELLDRFREHFESVQILASRENEDGSTDRFYSGRGNWFARQGMARNYLDSNRSQELAEHLRKIIKEEEP